MPCRRPRRSAISFRWWSARLGRTARVRPRPRNGSASTCWNWRPTGLVRCRSCTRSARRRADRSAAEALIRRIVALDPNNLVATNELALILLGKGNLAEAEIHARNAVRIAPENPQAHNLMGMIMTEANRPQVGEYHYRRVLELTGQRDPILLANLAWNLKNQGRMAEARALYEESVAAAPDIRQTLLGLARLEEADRNFDGAARILDTAGCAVPQRSGCAPDARRAARPHAEIRRGAGADRRVSG